jgi:hypothetical protein
MAVAMVQPYGRDMPSETTPRTLTVLARAAGVAALGLLAVSFAYGWFAYPTNADCSTADGYDAIRAHSELLATLALLAVAAAGAGGIVCVVGVATVAGQRMSFLLGGLLFVPIGLAALLIAFASGFYCQN